MKQILKKLKKGTIIQVETLSNLKFIGRFFATRENYLYAILDLGIFTAIPIRSILNIKTKESYE
jgi:hypothetical protein